ncbi:hypothetical protein ABZN20_18310 [Methylococcus sp. ANG]|uniref:hypothetical protein n=1 Tax=unclassified Methylococcus TaxID=2618889 RepID=UPI001C5304CE|nr:hypothetical protein [Methylococcus sp. Mc7]QXP82806.1 hypothetical protein KW115_11340 [Methylococcus sp. Mc7]
MPYIRSILHGRTKPHVFSWFIWARGLAEATCRLTRQVGGALLALMGRLIQTVPAAGTADAAELAARQTPELERLKALCESHQDSSSEKLGAFCRGMLKDWTVIDRCMTRACR